MTNPKKKIILTGKHGRPSTKKAWSSLITDPSNPITLVQRRQFINKYKKLIKYYRVFGDTSLYNESDLYQLKFKQFNFDNSIIIRWGTREQIDTTNSIIYNKASAIENATNKAVSRKIFIDKGVSTPTLLNNVEDYKGGIIIARPFIHSKGKNLVVLNNYTELVNHWRKGWYYSEFIDKQREFRVHCGHGKVLALMEKTKPSNSSIAWNRAINDTEPFKRITQAESDEQNLIHILKEALKAVEALKLDMGGVDIMLDKNNIPYVLEVNTAPTLNSSPAVAALWAKYWKWLLDSTEQRLHWDYNLFKKTSSLFWKQNQFLNHNLI